MPRAKEIVYLEQGEKRERLEKAYHEMMGKDYTEWLAGNWMRLRSTTFRQGGRVAVSAVLDKACTFCTGGLLVRLGLEQIGAPPPEEIEFIGFLYDHYGLTSANINFIIRWNDAAEEALIKGAVDGSATAKSGGLRALAVLLGEEEATITDGSDVDPLDP